MGSNSKEYNRAYYHKRRTKVNGFMGGRCNRCGSTEDLQIDHVDPSEKSFEVDKNLTISNEETLKELKKCQLLCKVCHKNKTSKENSGFTHGTVYAWMKARCSCKICTASKRAWHDKRNASRRK